MASSDPDATINIGSAGRPKKPNVYPVETPEEELNVLPDATQLEPHIPTLSQTFFNSSGMDVSSRETESLKRRMSLEESQFDPDDTIVDETVIASQIEASCNEDEELVDLLAGLASEANEEEEKGEKSKVNKGEMATQESSPERDSTKDMFSSGNTSQSPRPSQDSNKSVTKSQQSATSHPRRRRTMEEVEAEEAESLEMSQIVWDSAPILEEQSRLDSSLWGDENLDNTFFENFDIEDMR